MKNAMFSEQNFNASFSKHLHLLNVIIRSNTENTYAREYLGSDIEGTYYARKKFKINFSTLLQ